MVTVDMAVESVDMEVASEATVVVVEIVEAAEVYKNKVVWMCASKINSLIELEQVIYVSIGTFSGQFYLLN